MGVPSLDLGFLPLEYRYKVAHREGASAKQAFLSKNIWRIWRLKYSTTMVKALLYVAYLAHQSQANVDSIGATGHIGGAVLDVIVSTTTSLDVTALVRDESKAKRLREKYPNVKTIIGDLENVELVKSAAIEAEIVISRSEEFEIK